MAHRISIASALAVALTPWLGAQTVNEYHVKAAYLYNLALFVQWPPETFASRGEPMGLCVLGESPLRKVLAEAVKGETIDGRSLLVREVSGPAPGCQVLFIAASERERARSILQALKGHSTLTVGETDEFLAEGGAVTFRLEGDKVRIEISLGAMAEQRLRVSPQLLNLPRVVKR